MKLDIKINEYKNNIEALQAVESLEVYRWLISLGEKLNEDPLSEIKRVEKNKVKKGTQWVPFFLISSCSELFKLIF